MDGVEIESVIKAPISGYVLERMVDIGDPVVPLTSLPGRYSSDEH